MFLNLVYSRQQNKYKGIDQEMKVVIKREGRSENIDCRKWKLNRCDMRMNDKSIWEKYSVPMSEP